MKKIANNNVLGLIGIVVGIIALVYAISSSFKLSSQLKDTSEGLTSVLFRAHEVLKEMRVEMNWRSKTSNWMGRVIYMKEKSIRMLIDEAIDSGHVEIASRYKLTSKGEQLLNEIELLAIVNREYINAEKESETLEPDYFLLRILSTGEFGYILKDYNKRTEQTITLEQVLGTLYIYADLTKKKYCPKKS